MFRRGAQAETPANGAEQANGSHANGAHANGRQQANGRVDVMDPAGKHTRAPAELAVRLQPYPALRVGEPMSIGVRLDQLHFFDPQGNRIDVGWR
jgi:multiple sugar transport system ATP-binding protein